MRNPRDFWTGVIFAGLGMGAVIMARDYPMGSATKMGPAFFPSAVGAVLALLGVISIVRSFLQPGEPIDGFAWKPIVLVVMATVVFAGIVRGAGLAVALIVLVLVSALASRMFRWPTSLALAAALTLFSIIVFVKALGLPLPIVGPWLGG